MKRTMDIMSTVLKRNSLVVMITITIMGMSMDTAMRSVGGSAGC